MEDNRENLSNENIEINSDEHVNRINVVRHKWPDEIAAEKRRTRNRVLIIVCCIVCLIGGFFIGASGNSKADVSTPNNGTNTSSDKFNQIYNIMANDWYFGKDMDNIDSTLMDQAIKGLTTNDSDTHTEYYTAKEAETLTDSLSGKLVGIGIEYYDTGDYYMINKVFIDSPAEKSGVKNGDIIKKINGTDIKGKSSKEIVSLIRGEKGTTVNITFVRDGKEINKDIIRDEVNISAYGYVDDEGNGVLEIDTFADTTADEVGDYLKKFKKEKVKNIIIDLRENGGGYVDTAVNIASYFLDDDSVVLYQRSKDGTDVPNKTMSLTSKYTFDHMVILVDENTASASEILTTCLKHYLDCTIVGTTTYGKGTVQTTTPFSDGSYFKYTIAEWLSPDKESINGKGIKPDIEVKLNEAINYQISKDKKEYSYDSVGDLVKDCQVYLDFLGYDVDRKDGYFSSKTESAVKAYQKDNSLNEDGKITTSLIESLVSASAREYHQNIKTLDKQMIKAKEVVSGK